MVKPVGTLSAGRPQQNLQQRASCLAPTATSPSAPPSTATTQKGLPRHFAKSGDPYAAQLQEPPTPSQVQLEKAAGAPTWVLIVGNALTETNRRRPQFAQHCYTFVNTWAAEATGRFGALVASVPLIGTDFD